jgi:hypothetical protein
MAEVDMVCDDDARAAKLGAEIARVLQLRHYLPSKPMWETTQGLKTDAGLARTVLGLMQAEAEQMEQKYYNVFHRTWWKEAETPGWPNGLEPCAGKRHYIKKHVTYADARELCDEYNSTHEPGRLSDKAEFEESD